VAITQSVWMVTVLAPPPFGHDDLEPVAMPEDGAGLGSE